MTKAETQTSTGDPPAFPGQVIRYARYKPGATPGEVIDVTDPLEAEARRLMAWAPIMEDLMRKGTRKTSQDFTDPSGPDVQWVTVRFKDGHEIVRQVDQGELPDMFRVVVQRQGFDETRKGMPLYVEE